MWLRHENRGLFAMFSLRGCYVEGVWYILLLTDFCPLISLFLCILFFYRASASTRDIDIANLSVRPSVRDVTVSDETGLTYRHSFFHHTVAQSF